MLILVTKDNHTRCIMVETGDAWSASIDERRQIAFRRVYQRKESNYTELMQMTSIPEIDTIDHANAKHLLNME